MRMRRVPPLGVGLVAVSLAAALHAQPPARPLNEREAFEARLLDRVDVADLDSARAVVRSERARVPALVGALLAARTADLLAARDDAAAAARQRARTVAGLFADVYADSLCFRMLRFYEELPADRRRPVATCWDKLAVVRGLDETSQWAAARDRLQDLLAAAHAAADPYLELRATNLAGRCIFMTGDFDAARAHWQRAVLMAQRLRDLNTEARCLGNVAFTFQAQDRAADAITILPRAVDAARRLGDRNFLAWCLNALGNNHLIRSDFEAARRSYEEALEIARKDGFRGLASEIAGNLANVLAYLGDYERAVALQEDGLRVAREMGRENKRNELNAHFMMAWLRSSMGQHSRALALLRQALPLAEAAGTADQTALLHTQIGEVYRQLGRPDEALQHYAQAIPIFRKAGIRRFEIWALLATGRVHAEAGRLDAALATLEEARRIVEPYGKNQLLVLTLCDLGWLHTLRGEMDQAEMELTTALARAESLGNPVLLGTVECRLGRVHAARGNADRAADLFRRAVQRGRSFPAPSLLEEALVEEARWRRGRGELATADSLLAAALASVETVRGEQGGEEIRVGFLATRKSIYTERIGVLQEIGAADARRPTAHEAAFQVAERAHARSLLDALGHGRVDPGAGIDSSLCEKERKLAAHLGRIQTEMSRTVSAETWERSRFDSLGALLDTTRTAYREVLEEIAVHRPAYGTVSGQRQPLGVAAVRRRVLRPDQVLLEYVTGEDESFLFLVTHDAFRMVRLPEGARGLRERVDAFRSAMLAGSSRPGGSAQPLPREDATSPPPEAIAAARALYKLLVEPIAASLPEAARLVVVADGPLHLLPFAALHDGVHYLIERHAIAYAPSATLLDPELRIRKRPLARSLLAVGNPATYRATELLAALRDASGWSFGEIPHAEEEAQRVATHFDVQRVLVGETATEETVKSAAGSASHLHFAVHGLLDEAEPMLSGLVLAQDEDPAEDGLLQVHEIQQLQLDADLVTLSACSSGLGRIADGEGVLGLTWAFLYAGARSLVLTLWDIGDRSTVDLMDTFYGAAVAKAEPPDRALQAAQVACIGRGRPPSEWAPFVFVGDVRPFASGTRAGWWAPAGGAAVLVFLLAAALRRRRRRRSSASG